MRTLDKAAILQAMDNVDYKAVRRAALALSLKSDEERVAMLLAVADALDARRQEIEKALSVCGFAEIRIDPEGYRRGAMNKL